MIRNDILELHKKEACGENKDLIFDICWTHSLIVEEMAMDIADKLIKEGYVVDKNLVSLGALIHDIGTYRIINEKIDSILHGEIGYKIAIENKINKDIANFCLTHIGVGISKEEIINQRLNLDLNINHLTTRLEEEIVAYADNYHSKGKKVKFHKANEIVNNFSKFEESQQIRLKNWTEKFGEINIDKYENKYKKWQDEVNDLVLQIRQG